MNFFFGSVGSVGSVGRQAADAVALEEAVQGRAREVRDGLLQGIAAVIERQLRVLAEGHGHGFFRG